MIEETQDYLGLAPWCSKLDTAPEMKSKLINSWFAHSDKGVHLSYPGHMWKNNEQGQDSPPRCPYSNTTGSNAGCGRYVNFEKSQTLREQGIKPRQRVVPASYNLVNKYLSWIFHDFILFYFFCENWATSVFWKKLRRFLWKNQGLYFVWLFLCSILWKLEIMCLVCALCGSKNKCDYCENIQVYVSDSMRKKIAQL